MVIIAQGKVSLAASWATAVEHAMDNQLSGRGRLKLSVLLMFLSKLFTRVQAVLFMLLVILMGISVS